METPGSSQSRGAVCDVAAFASAPEHSVLKLSSQAGSWAEAAVLQGGSPGAYLLPVPHSPFDYSETSKSLQ